MVISSFMPQFDGLAYFMTFTLEATFLEFSSRNSILYVFQKFNSVFYMFKFEAGVTVQMCECLIIRPITLALSFFLYFVLGPSSFYLTVLSVGVIVACERIKQYFYSR